MKKLNLLWMGLLALCLAATPVAFAENAVNEADSAKSAKKKTEEVSEANIGPTQVLKDVSSRLIARLNKDKKEIKTDPKVIIDIVDTIIMPVTDFDLIAKRVLGHTWKNASVEQRQTFLKEFKLLLIVTYIAAFRSYENQSVEFTKEILPPDENPKKPKRVEVQTEIHQSGSPPVKVNYRLHKAIDAKDPNMYRWLVYDFNVEGVGLTYSFRLQFKDAVAEKGINGMLADMRKKNEEFFGKE